jgi:hypothetical protein
MSARVQSALLATYIVTLTSEANAFEVKHSAAGLLVSWRSATVAWTIDSSVAEVKGGEDAVVAAVAAWSQRGGAPTLAVTQRGAHVEPGLDGINAVVFAEGGFPPAGNALAVTVLSFDDRSGEVLDADIVLNGKYELGTVGKGTTHPTTDGLPEGKTYDIGRVVAHEMGHGLALSDELAKPAALMYPYVPREVVMATAPSDDDVAGLSVLYADVADGVLDPSGQPTAGAAPPSPSSSCAAVPLRSSSSPAAGWMTAGVVLLGLGAAVGRGARGRRARRGAAGCTMLAAAALVVLPPATAGAQRVAPASAFLGAREVRAVVSRVRTTSVDGLFRSELELAPTACREAACPPVYRVRAWGGTIDHVRQVIGGLEVPEEGEVVALALEPEAPAGASQIQAVRAMTRLAR